MSPATGPTWTRTRLRRVMALRFGFAADGQGVDTRAAASAMGVSRRTVQRWLHADHGRSKARIPARRLDQLIELLMPGAETVGREAQQARYAVEAIARIGLARGMGIKPAWRERRWLEEHLVVVIEIKVRTLRIRQIAVGRADTTHKLAELQRRGRILDQALVPTKFHATVLTHQVLTALGPWRFQAGQTQVAAGFTQVWLGDAPASDLAATAEALRQNPGADTGQVTAVAGEVTEDGTGAPSSAETQTSAETSARAPVGAEEGTRGDG